MSALPMDRIVRDGISAGLLPATAELNTRDHRPWQVLVLTALGAWLSAIPLIFLVGTVFDAWVRIGATSIILGSCILAGAVQLLRGVDVPFFLEQLAVPALMVAFALLGNGFSHYMPWSAACAALALVAAIVASIVPRAWQRVLLGAATAILLGVSLSGLRSKGFSARLDFQSAWQVVIGLWIGLHALQGWLLAQGRSPRALVALESITGGIAISALAGLIVASGQTFLVGGIFGGAHLGSAGPGARASMGLLPPVSLVLALASLVWVPLRWKAMRTWWYAAGATLIAVVAWFSPPLGSTLIVIALCATSGRMGIAGFAAFSAAWIIGGFYYQLQWPLATKAMLLAGVGAAMCGVARLAMSGAGSSDSTADPATTRSLPRPAASRLGSIISSAVLVLIVVNIAIARKETLLRNGESIFVALAPADPRSLLQGDYMRLNFEIPEVGQVTGRPHVVARRDARGIASFLRIDNGNPLQPGEFLIELSQKNGRWILVTDAWLFLEREADRWRHARYGEFHIDPDGRALLVGLRGAALEKL